MRRIILTTLPVVALLTLFGSIAEAQSSLQGINGASGDSLLRAGAKDSILAQSVESRKGYIARIPAGARLDSSRSGWNPKGLYEQRVYEIEGAGAIIFTVTVKQMSIPELATKTQAYTFVDSDSLTSAGTARIRTYYLSTRSVRIELIPYGVGMRGYIEERERIFNSFRWKPGAETETIDIDSGPVFNPANVPPPVNSLGG